MSTSTIPAVLDALVDALALRAGLSGVDVLSAWAGDSAPRTCIELATEVTIDEEPAAMGGARAESYDVKCEVTVVYRGAGETAIRGARDQAFAYFAEVETCLNDDNTVGGLCTDTNLSKGTMKQGITPEGRACSIEFTIAVQAQINP